MRTDKELDELYDRASQSPGWLSYLMDAHAIDDIEMEYLLWRDECAAPVQAKMRIWEAQIERDGLELINAETPEEQLLAVKTRILWIDDQCHGQPYAIAETLRTLWRYRQLVSLRAVLHLQLVPPELMAQERIDKARSYPLSALLDGQLKRGFMKCPVHPEKHASFHVTSYGFCFGCLRSWNAIGWLMDFQRMTFRQAVECLASKT